LFLKNHPFLECILWILSISRVLGGHEFWGNLLTVPGEPPRATILHCP